MRRDKSENSFVWRPTNGARGRLLAILTIAMSCAFFGFVAGRLFPTKPVLVSTVDDTSKPSRPSSLKHTPPKSDGPAADKAAAVSPSFTLLNPGTVIGNEAHAAPHNEINQMGPSSGPNHEVKEEGFSRTELPPRKAAGKRVDPTHLDRTDRTLADYGALRDYMMRR